MAGNFQTCFLSWDLDPDPDPRALFHSSQFPPNGQNIVFYKNPAADALIDQGRRELDHTKRIAIYRRLHALLADDQPYTWTIQVSLKWAVSKRIRNVKESKGWGLLPLVSRRARLVDSEGAAEEVTRCHPPLRVSA